MFGIDDLIIKVARQVLDGVLSQINNLINNIQEQALQPMRMIAQQVTGGVWKGDGANAFVDDILNKLIPSVLDIVGNITTTHKNITTARDIIDRADSDIGRLVKSGLTDKFKFY